MMVMKTKKKIKMSKSLSKRKKDKIKWCKISLKIN